MGHGERLPAQPSGRGKQRVLVYPRPRTPFIDSRYHVLRQLILRKAVRMVYVQTSDQIADTLTKLNPAPLLRRFRDVLSGDAYVKPPDPDGPAGRLGRAALEPVLFPSLQDV